MNATRTRTQRRAIERARTKHPSGARMPPPIVILVAFVVIAAVAAFVIVRTSHTTAARAETGVVTVSGEDLPLLATGAPDTAIGLRAPDVVGTNFDGARVAIVKDGRPKAILLLAHWCPHCQNEVPRVQRWVEAQGMPSNADLYSVSTFVDSSRGNYPPSAWLNARAWSIPVLADDMRSTAAAAFGLHGTPMWVFLNSDGTVASRTSGETPIADVERAIAALR